MVVLLVFRGRRMTRGVAGRAGMVVPVWSTSAMIGLALPLFLVTMASAEYSRDGGARGQWLPPAGGQTFQVTGLFTLLAAPFGGHAVESRGDHRRVCAGPRASRSGAASWAAVVAGAAYVVFGLLAGAAISLLRSSIA